MNIRVKLTYETDLTTTDKLRNKIVLTVAQKQKTGESENKKGQEFIIENFTHNSTQIFYNLYFELLENATKISFEEFKKIWESTEDLEKIVAKNIEQKKYAITITKRASFLANFVVTHLHEIAVIRKNRTLEIPTIASFCFSTSYSSPYWAFALTENLILVSILYFLLFSAARPIISTIRNLKN